MCDFIAVNLYPSWNWQAADTNNQPIDPNTSQAMTVQNALAPIQKQYSALKNQYPDKQIIITEIGWPTAYGWVVDVPQQATQSAIGLSNAQDFFNEIKSWAENNEINVYYYSMYDDWYGVDTNSQFNFHFGLLDSTGQVKEAD